MQECARLLAIVRRAILLDSAAVVGATIPTTEGWPASVPGVVRKVIQSTWDALLVPSPVKKKGKKGMVSN
jgi:hypothetical protein